MNIWKLVDSNGILVEIDGMWCSGYTNTDEGNVVFGVPKNEDDDPVVYTLIMYDEDDPSCSGKSTVIVPACESSECNCNKFTLSPFNIIFDPDHTNERTIIIAYSDCVEDVMLAGVGDWNRYFTATMGQDDTTTNFKTFKVNLKNGVTPPAGGAICTLNVTCKVNGTYCTQPLQLTAKYNEGGNCNCNNLSLTPDSFTFSQTNTACTIVIENSDCVESVTLSGTPTYFDLYFTAEEGTDAQTGFRTVTVTEKPDISITSITVKLDIICKINGANCAKKTFTATYQRENVCDCEILKEAMPSCTASTTPAEINGVGKEHAIWLDINPNNCYYARVFQNDSVGGFVAGWSDDNVSAENACLSTTNRCKGRYLWIWATEETSEPKDKSYKITTHLSINECYTIYVRQNPASNCNCGNVNINNIRGVQGISAAGSSSHPVVTFNANTDYCSNTDFSIVHTGDDRIVTNPQPIITADYYAFTATVPANESIYGKKESMKLILNNDSSCENSYPFTVAQNGCSCNISSLYPSTNPYKNDGSTSSTAIGTYTNNTCGDLTPTSSADWVTSLSVYTPGKQFLAVIAPNNGDSRDCIVTLINRNGEQVGEIEVYQHSCTIEDLTCTAGEYSPIGIGAGEYEVGTFRKSVDCHVNVTATPSEYTPAGNWVNSIRCNNYHSTGGYDYFKIYADVKAATTSSGVRSCKITFRDQKGITNLNNGYNFEIYQGNI